LAAGRPQAEHGGDRLRGMHLPGTVDLSRFDNTRNSQYDAGRSLLIRTVWFLVGLPLLRSAILPSSRIRRSILRWFGAEIGPGVVIRPGVRVKFPWKLRTGKYCWIGEDCWIDNLAEVTLGDHVCVSQGTYLCTGSHDWSDPAFGLITRAIQIHDGAWIGARASVGPGSVIGHHAVVGFGSVVTGAIPPYEIHAGNPATRRRLRKIGDSVVPRFRSERTSQGYEVPAETRFL
jgi:putative colanic acid biosynthesis acetyltransferase WcaF